MVSMITIRLCHHNCADCSVGTQGRAAGGRARRGLGNLTINTNLTLILQVQVETLTHQHYLSVCMEKLIEIDSPFVKRGNYHICRSNECHNLAVGQKAQFEQEH